MAKRVGWITDQPCGRAGAECLGWDAPEIGSGRRAAPLNPAAPGYPFGPDHDRSRPVALELLQRAGRAPVAVGARPSVVAEGSSGPGSAPRWAARLASHARSPV